MGDDAAWGRSAVEAFGAARFRLLLSGTPFRTDNTPIPWVGYDADGVSRARLRLRLHGRAAGRRLPAGHLPHLRRRHGVDERRAPAPRRLRASGCPRPRRPAGCARRSTPTATGSPTSCATPTLRLERIARRRPPRRGRAGRRGRQGARRGARAAPGRGGRRGPGRRDARRARTRSARIARFAAGSGAWLVSVLMVSEGVDIPRLRVGVYATSARTELFFRQVVGRFIRRTPGAGEQMSHLFLPADPTLSRLAAQRRGGAPARARARGRAASSLAEPVERRARGAERRRSTRCGRARTARRRGAPDHPARRRAAAVRRARAAGRRGLRRRRTGARRAARPVAPGRRDAARAPRAPAGGARRARLRARAPHGRAAPDDPRARQSRDGRPSVAAATAAQLERGNALLEREARADAASGTARGRREAPQRPGPRPAGRAPSPSSRPARRPPHAIPVSTAVRTGPRTVCSRSRCGASRSRASARSRAARSPSSPPATSASPRTAARRW